MPYTLKTQQIAVKDPDTGVYSGVDILAEQTTEGLLTEITATGEAVKADVSAQMATERSDFNTYVSGKEAELDQYKSTTETNINTYVTNKNQEIATMIADADKDVSDLEDRKQDVADAVAGMLSKGVDNTLTTANVPAESKATGDLFETIVEGKATQPTDKWNRLWIKPSANDYEIPTMDEFDDLKSAIVNYSELYADGETVISPKYLNKNSSGGKPTSNSNKRLISEPVTMPPESTGTITKSAGTSAVVYRFDETDTLINSTYAGAAGTETHFDRCDHIRVVVQYSNNDPITPNDGLEIVSLKFYYHNRIPEYVTPEMFTTVNIEDAIEAAIATGKNVKSTSESYNFSRSVQISGCSNQILDFTNTNITYTGSDYAFTITDTSNVEFLFKSIKATNGGCFRLAGADSKYCQYINFEGLYINAKTNAFYATAETDTWVNEIRCKMFRISGNPDNAFLLNAQTGGGAVNTWRFFNIGFEGVGNGLTLYKSGYHIIESCRYDEGISKLLVTYYNGCKGINIFGSYKLNTNLFTLNDDTEVIVNSPITFDGTSQTHYYGIYRNNKWGFDNLFTDMLPGTNNFNEILMTGKYRINTSDAYHAPSLIPYGYLIVQNLLSLDTCTQIYVSTYITDDHPYAMAIRSKPNNNFQSWKYIRAEVLSDL